MPIKQKSLSLLRNLALGTFSELPIVFLAKINWLYLLYSTTRRCFLLHKAKLFDENISKNSTPDDSGISLPVFLSRTNLKLQDGWKGHNETWFLKGIWCWLHSIGGSKELWPRIFLHKNWTFQEMSEGILFARLLKFHL